MVRLVVHADDFGLSAAVNEGILAAHQNGILTSASLTACGAAFDQAIAQAHATPSLDVGVHLTLVEEKPVLDPSRIPTLVNGDGRFHRHANVFFQRFLSGKIRLTEVRDELEAQIKKISSRKIPISHLDSHQHLHILPGLIRITAELGKAYGIPVIRLPRERLPLRLLLQDGSLSRFLQMRVLSLFCGLGNRFIARRADHFFGFLAGGDLNRKNLCKILELLPPGVSELMCHPGMHDPATPYAHWRYHWQDELDALTDNEIMEFIREREIRLISFRELAN
jgi:hopanoid biosynthesis associated protein HpnK